MFELESAIANWRSELLHKQTMTMQDIDELESHLREEVESLNLSGLSKEEAFMVSSHRIGDSSVITQEYAKVNSKEIWRNRVFWMLSGVFALMVITSLSSFLSAGSKAVFTWFNISPSLTGIVSSSVQIFASIGLVIALVGCLRNISSNIQRRQMKFRNVLWQCILLIFLLKTFTFFLSIFHVQRYGLEGLKTMSVASRYVLGSWTLIWPLVLAGLLLWLRPARKGTAT
ncbi:MAG: hypothetical protein ACYTET_02715 [Planctomycetota bacterium]|jgi:hypothetical protein